TQQGGTGSTQDKQREHPLLSRLLKAVIHITATYQQRTHRRPVTSHRAAWRQATAPFLAN
ncbi:Hypothetical predicted protein, partial [Pelobates cultripes]